MKINNKEIEKYRITSGVMGSDSSYGNNGLFTIPRDNILKIIVSDGMDWEHVSVSRVNGIPSWNEMCFVKDLFWNKDETVIQFHPRKSRYINRCPYCLHLWRKIGHDYELPPSILIG